MPPSRFGLSPLRNAARLKAPVLLACGGDDLRAPLEHGTAFRDALDWRGKKHQCVVCPGEAHGFNDDRDRFDFYRRVEAFLRRHLNSEGAAQIAVRAVTGRP